MFVSVSKQYELYVSVYIKWLSRSNGQTVRGHSLCGSNDSQGQMVMQLEVIHCVHHTVCLSRSKGHTVRGQCHCV